MTLLCVPIKGPSLSEAAQQIEQARHYAEIVEWRLDFFDSLEHTQWEKLFQECPLQTIFTLRPQSQGGRCKLNEEERLRAMQRWVQLNPTYVDLEYTVSSEFVKDLRKSHPALKIILSYHDFEQTPSSLESILKTLRHTPADFYKIAVMARSANDTLSLLLSAREEDNRTLLMSMGETGSLSRILAPIVKRPFTYASLSSAEATAPGQIDAKDLLTIYHYRALNASTQIYGLIGQPVDKSISEYTHNHALQQLNLNSVYVKIPLETQQLSDFFTLAKQLGMRGLSVTMPLKEQVIPFLDEIDPFAQTVGAVNTILFVSDKLIGFNTDGKGALDAIETHLPMKNKKIILLGAGGASKAIAYEALCRNAEVLILNRDAEKAHHLADKLGCRGGSLDDIKGQEYDLIINSTPTAHPIDPQYLLPCAFAMDLTSKPKETPFLQQAHAQGCKLIYGYEMFIQQAVLQFQLWFPEVDSKRVEELLSAVAKLRSK